MNKAYLDSLQAEICCVIVASYAEYAYLMKVYPELDWEQSTTHVQVLELGKDHGRPVSVKLSARYVNGSKILLAEPISRIFNADMVDAWLKQFCAPKDGRSRAIAHGTALDFYPCKAAIEKAPMHPDSQLYRERERSGENIF